MKTATKLKTFLIIFFIAVFAVIAARHFIGLHFKKKFSVRPAPGVIVNTVEKSLFYKSIETFGTAIAQNSKTYRVRASEIAGKLNIENRFVKKDEIILTLKDGEELKADFAGKVGKREIAQGVLGSESLIITLDDLKRIVTVAIGIATVIGGLLMRDRHMLATIRKGDEDALRHSREGDDRLHERINRVRDEYVRRDDHDRSQDALRELLMDIRQGQAELNRRIDQVLTRNGGGGGDRAG